MENNKIIEVIITDKLVITKTEHTIAEHTYKDAFENDGKQYGATLHIKVEGVKPFWFYIDNGYYYRSFGKGYKFYALPEYVEFATLKGIEFIRKDLEFEYHKLVAENEIFENELRKNLLIDISKIIDKYGKPQAITEKTIHFGNSPFLSESFPNADITEVSGYKCIQGNSTLDGCFDYDIFWFSHEHLTTKDLVKLYAHLNDVIKQ